jgi:Flp pilus assembly protein TadG
MHLIKRLSARLAASRKAAVSLVFATAVIPLLMMVGLALDYGLYSEAQSQLDMAADAAAMHAARISAQLLQQNDPACETKGATAGQRWFASQLGLMPQAKQINPPIITVTCSQANTSVTAKVDYSGIIIANFGTLIPTHWPSWPNWNIGGTATAVISNPTYIEVLMLLDNSSSMMIAATQADIVAMQQLTPCSAQSAKMGQNFDQNYSWAYTLYNGVYETNPPNSAFSPVSPKFNAGLRIPYGFGTFVYPDSTDGTPKSVRERIPKLVTSPTSNAIVGRCDDRFTGPADECAPPGYILNPAISAANGVSATTGKCLNGKGGDGFVVYAPNLPAGYTVPKEKNMPQAPCAFACHNNKGDDDYYGLAKANHVQLRYDFLQSAAKNVIKTMSGSPTASRLSVGVYQFNAPLTADAQPSGISQVYPPAASSGSFAETEAGPATDEAENLTKNVDPPVTQDQPDTNFENAMTLLGNFVTPSGAGNYPAAPKKNLFIVTDGLDDYYTDPAARSGSRTQGPINPAACDKLKNEGFTIYVLYTPYFPLANPFYLGSDRLIVEGASPVPGYTNITYAMSECASNGDFYSADPSDKNSIDEALQTMLAAALGSAGRLKD